MSILLKNSQKKAKNGFLIMLLHPTGYPFSKRDIYKWSRYNGIGKYRKTTELNLDLGVN